MTTATAVPRNTAAAFLTHFFGSGLADDRYVVERLRALAPGDIRPCSGENPAPATKGKHRAKRATASLKAVKELRPARTEIIVCTGLKTRGRVQIWATSRRAFSTTASSAADGARPGRPAGHPSPTRGADAGRASPARIPNPAREDLPMTEQDIELRRNSEHGISAGCSINMPDRGPHCLLQANSGESGWG